MTWLELDGAVNVRDLGGLPAGDGRQVVPGRLLRGDDLNDLSPADVTLLVGQLGLTTVIDLRSPGEVRARGPGPLTRGGLVRHRQHSLLPELGLTPAADAMTARVERAQARYPDDARCGLYLGYLEERPAQVVSALRDIARASGPVLVHCAAGKDRTGVVVALALSVAGVQRDAVIADYAATGERIDAIMERLRSSPTYAADLLGHVDEDHTPRPETMAAFLDQLQQRHGGVLAWLTAHGFGQDEQDQLRARLLGG